LENRKISDLENSKAREIKYYDEQIKFWNEVTEMVNDVEALASAENAVKQLIKDNIVPEGSTIPQTLDIIRQRTNLDNLGHVNSLGAKFDDIKTNYLEVAKKLWEADAQWQINLNNIAKSLDGFAGSEDMVQKFKEAFVAGASALDINVNVPENNVDLEQLKQDLATAKDYLNSIKNSSNAFLVSSAYKGLTSTNGTWSNGAYGNVAIKSGGYYNSVLQFGSVDGE
jgi:hypothetical protein